MRRRIGMLVVLGGTSLCAAGGCGGDTTSAQDVADHGGGGDADADADADAPGDAAGDVSCAPATTSCNTVLLGGATVQAMQVAEDAPTLTGGTVVAGSYDLASDTVYTGAGGAAGPLHAPLRVTLVLGATTFERKAEHFDPTGCTTEEESGTYTTTGSTLRLTFSCPGPMSPTAFFQTDGTTLILELDTGEQETYARE